MIKKIILALLLGIMATLVCMQYDPAIKQIIGDGFKQAFEQALDCHFEGTLKHINFFSPTIEFEDVVVRPKQPENSTWKWQAKIYKTQFSWVHLLCKGVLDLRVFLSDVHAASNLEGSTLSIMNHVERMIVGTADIPLLLKVVSLENAHFTLTDTQRQCVASCNWSSDVVRIGPLMRCHVTIHDGSFSRVAAQQVSAFSGMLSMDIDDSKPGIPEINAKNSVRFACHAHNAKPITCFVHGSWHGKKGTFMVQTDVEGVAVDALEIALTDFTHLGFQVQAHAPIQALASYLKDYFQTPVPLHGNLHVAAHADMHNGTWCNMHAQLTGTQLMYENTPVCDSLQLNASYGASLTGSLQAHSNNITCAGTWAWDVVSGKGQISLKNTTDVVIPYAQAHIKPHDGTLSMTVDSAGCYAGTYAITAGKAEKKIIVQGTFDGDLHGATALGAYDDAHFELACIADPLWYVKKFVYTNAQGQSLIRCAATQESPKKIMGDIDFSCIKKMLQPYAGDYLQGQGLVAFALDVGSYDNIKGQLKFHKGSIRLPQTYNVVQELLVNTQIDTVHKKIIIKDAFIHLNKGSISCTGVILQANDAFDLSFAYVPLLLDNCLFTVKKDVFVALSGNMLLTYSAPNMPMLTGHLIIDRSQIKENIFSVDFQKNFMKNNAPLALPQCALDCIVETKDALRIKTALLEMNAHGCLHITQTVSNPALSGTITCTDGILQFPYKPLYITKSSLSLVADHIEDSCVELVARNTIKNYEIILTISGSLKDHHISLTATPSLTENQIVSLLFVGSQEESLNAVVPALVMENLKTVLFESEHSPLQLTGSFKQLLTPLKKIHLVPRFTDQTGRGGLRGAIEVDVNDRVRALIQKNFSLTEDTRFELEYLLSDDVSVRGIRDERRDVNAEVEMRWKF